MASVLPDANDCCAPCDACDETTQIPGPQGPAGADGADGADGDNAWMALTSNFTMPAEQATSVANTTDNTSFAIGQVVFLVGLGYLQITAKPTSTTTTLKNLEDTATSAYTSNAVAGTVAGSGSLISPAGIQGPTGVFSGVAGGDLSGTYPNPTLAITTTKGDLIVRGASANIRLAVGANGTRPVANSSTASGLDWSKVNLASGSEVTGSLTVVNGGTGLTAGTSGGIPFFSATNAITSSALLAANAVVVGGGAGTTPASLASLGTSGQVLTSAGAGSPPSFQDNAARPPLIYCYEAQAQGVAGGSFTAGGYRQRTLNTEVDPTSIATLAANRVTVPAGSYEYMFICPANAVDKHQALLHDVTNAIYYPGASSSAPSGQQNTCIGMGYLVLTGSTILELVHVCQTNKTTDGFGQASNLLATGEIYSQLWLKKVA